MTSETTPDSHIEVVAVRQAVDPGIVDEVVQAESALLGVTTTLAWVDGQVALREAVATSRAQGHRVLALTDNGCGPLDWLEAGPVVVRVDLGLVGQDRSSGLTAHVYGRGVAGVGWGLRTLVHRGRWPVEVHAYGDRSEQVAHLRLPLRPAERVPVIALLHGGFWRAKWALDLMDALAIDLAQRGWATWNVEYRRAVQHGWDAMASDVLAAVEHLSTLDRPDLDLSQLVLLGHSAGGQLAAQAGARLASGPSGLRPALVVHLAGVTDVQAAYNRDLGDGAVRDASAPLPVDQDLWATTSPQELLPLGIQQLVVIGSSDSLDLREMARRYASAAHGAGDDIVLLEVEGDHFDVIDPTSTAWRHTAALLPQVGPTKRDGEEALMTNAVTTPSEGQQSTREVATVIEELYAALGNRPAFDQHLHTEVTIWESDAETMLTGLAELDRLRDLRAAGARSDAEPPRVTPESMHIDIWGDTAVARYLLHVEHAEATSADSFFRVTDVLRREDERWLIVHHHAEAVAD